MQSQSRKHGRCDTNEHAISNQRVPLDSVSPYCHDESDTRVFVQARDATMKGSKSLTIEANDTNESVIAVSVMSSLQLLGLQTLWITFGQGSSARWIPVHETQLLQ